MKRTNQLIGLLLAVGLLVACSRETLYTDLDQQQANEMLALLIDGGIDANKLRADNGWTLEAPRDDLPRAMSILSGYGYPRVKFDTLGNVFRKEGFVSTPLEERARLLFGLSQELSHTISSIDGVILARVHLAIPERRPLTNDRGPASAAVFIKHRQESAIDSQLSSIKALVVNSVEGLPYDNVTVTLSPSTPSEVAEPNTTAATSSWLSWLLAAGNRHE